MVTASDVQPTSTAGSRGNARAWPPWLFAACLVLPLVAPLVWTGFRIRLYSDPVLAAVSPVEAPWSIRDPLGAWALLGMYTLANDFVVGAPVTFGLCAIAAYIIGSDTVIRRMKAFRA